jgi:AraC-like DNA-binding protein
MPAVSLSLVEWLAVTGLAQSLLIIVYIAFRVRNWRQASLALAYFSVLALSFGLQFSLRLDGYEEPLRIALWFARMMGPPLCCLLVLQIGQGEEKGADLPPRRRFWVLGLPFLALLSLALIGAATPLCPPREVLCPGLFAWLQWMGSITGAVSMLALWGHKNLFGALRKTRGGMERYWLVMVLVMANIGAVGISLLSSTESIGTDTTDFLFAMLELTFIYLAITVLFRVYPSPVALSAEPSRFTRQELTAEEKQLADRIRQLMETDKPYHEQAFNRASLAREMGVPENVLSRVVNVSFGKSFPRLLNELRVEDAKWMLRNNDIPIQVVAAEVGFNSLASFNRAFREITGITPSQYRDSGESQSPPV